MNSTKAYIICKEYGLTYKTLQKYLTNKKSFILTSLCSDIPNDFIFEIKNHLEEIKNQDNHSISIHHNEFLDDFGNNLFEEQDTKEQVENQVIDSPEESTHMFVFEKFYYNLDEKENLVDDELQKIIEQEDSLNQENYSDCADPEGDFWREWKSGDIERLGY